MTCGVTTSLADEYDEHWVYGSDYVPWMSARIAEALSLSSSDRIVDIGCGTGLFAREVERLVRPARPIVCADPSEPMLRQLGTDPGSRLVPLLASAEDLAAGHVGLLYAQLDAMWLKESAHHVADPAKTLQGLAGLLAPGGRLLVAMLLATTRPARAHGCPPVFVAHIR
ncbi:hypothetical protein N566_18260 [Streptomycetaceae bacterium MP113-05]|nr:hypothetical protein N566_18260 [Streptomycetaceae bacterium MP113-05]